MDQNVPQFGEQPAAQDQARDNGGNLGAETLLEGAAQVAGAVIDGTFSAVSSTAGTVCEVGGQVVSGAVEVIGSCLGGLG